jgi:hypothetical protein
MRRTSELRRVLTANRADMSTEAGHIQRCRPRAFGAATAFGMLMLGAGFAGEVVAQPAPSQTEAAPPGQLQPTDDPPPLPSPAQPAEPASPGAFRPGFLDAFGRWIDNSISDLNAGISGARGTIDKAGDVAKGAAGTAAGAAKDAAGAIAKLPVGRMVDGREKCAVAPNGSPDCYAAASLICKSKGYGEGKSVDTQTAQKCSARVWISGRSPKEGECTAETHVIRAVCQ